MIVFWLACTPQTIRDASKESQWEYIDEISESIAIVEGLNQPLGMLSSETGWLIAEYGNDSLIRVDNNNTTTVVLDNLDGPHSLWQDDDNILIATDSAIWMGINDSYTQMVFDIENPTHPRRIDGVLYWFSNGSL